MKTNMHTKRGFTLIELMIVVAIIAILAAVAYPSYLDQIRKTRRADGHSALMETAQRLERCYTLHGAYNAGACSLQNNDTVASSEGYYTVTVTSAASTFNLTAAGQGDQGDDKCGDLTYDNTGVKGIANADAGVTWQDCW